MLWVLTVRGLDRLVALAVADIVLFSSLAELGLFLGRPPSTMAEVPPETPLWFKGVHLATAMVLIFVMGGYQRRALADRRFMARCVLAALTAGLSGLLFLFLAAPPWRPWLPVALLTWISGFAGVILSRLLFAILADPVRRSRRILILGDGPKAARLVALKGGGPRRVAFVGCVGARAGRPGAMAAPRDAVLPLRSSELAAASASLRIDEIVVALDDAGDLPAGDLLECHLHGIPVIDYTAFLEREMGVVDIDVPYPLWLIGPCTRTATRLGGAAKRGFDLAFSAALLVATLPVTLVAVLAIRLEDAGPVLYRQERVGANNRVFVLLKFRSMRVDAEADGVARWATVDDDRVTRVGRILRKTRIDEIPQLLNVLKGEMSLIGPRPERPPMVRELSRQIPLYPYRHVVRPGITGWAQVNYPYGASVRDAEEKLKYDLFYIKNRNSLLDLIILLKTIRVVVWAVGSR